MKPLVDFLSRVLPKISHPETFYAFSLDANGKPFQVALSSVELLAQTTRQFSAYGRNAYFALGSFANAAGGRKQGNASRFQCFWADIDAGKRDSKYADMREALAGLVEFVKNTGLKPTFVVSSGKGLHVYWCLSRAVAADKWRAVATYFHRLCREQGLDVDPTRATDPASVLRVPGTTHQSSGNTVTILRDSGIVYDPKEFLSGVAAHLSDLTPPTVRPATPPRLVAESFAIEQGFIEAPSADAERILRNCPACLTAGKGLYPQWFAMMSVMKRCHNGREYAHKVSAIDPRYDYAATEKKFDDAAYDAPTLCSTFETICPDKCAQCRHRGQVKTPVQLSRLRESPVVAATPPPPPPPPPAPRAVPFAPIGPDGSPITRLQFPAPGSIPVAPLTSMQFEQDESGIYHITREKQPDGSFEMRRELITQANIQLRYCFYENEMDGLRAQRGYIFSVRPKGGVPEDAAFVIRTDMKADGVMTWLYNNKANPANAYIKPGVFMAFFNAYLNAVGNTVPELRTYDKFGWEKYVDHETRDVSLGFLTGNGMLTCDGFKPVNFGDLTAKDAYGTYIGKGSLEAWKAVPQMYRALKQRVGELAICMTFAAPLMMHGSGEAKNAILSIWSPESGIGKSQLLRACASIWGDPSKQFFTRQDSIVARARKLSLLKNLPAFMDEMTDISDEDLFSLAYTLANGKEKQKLRSTGASFVSTGDWSTTIITTSNRSVKEAISRCAGDSDATLQRVMEFRCDFKSYAHIPEMQKLINMCMKRCNENFGLAGPEFLYQLLHRPDRIETLTVHAENWFLEKGFLNKERFLGYSLFLALQAGRWAKEFGLIDFDMDDLEDWAVRTFLETNRAETAALSPDLVENFREYVNDQVPSMLIVRRDARKNDEFDPGTAGVPDKFVLRYPAAASKTVTARYEVETKTLYCSTASFKNWCGARHVSDRFMLSILKEHGVMLSKAQFSLTKNVRSYPTARVRCIKLTEQALLALGFGDFLDSPPE